MEKRSIKVVLAGRNYPLTIQAEEEGKVLAAVEMINSSIKRLQENYAVKDMQDLLAMTALQLATREQKTTDSEEIRPQVDFTELVTRLQELSKAMDAE